MISVTEAIRAVEQMQPKRAERRADDLLWFSTLALDACSV
jgi:hypothetical protein